MVSALFTFKGRARLAFHEHGRASIQTKGSTRSVYQDAWELKWGVGMLSPLQISGLRAEAASVLPVSHREGREGKWRMTTASKERSGAQKQAHLPAVHSQCRTHSALPPLQASNFLQWPGSTWVPIPSSLLPQSAQSLEVSGQSLLFFCSFSDVLFVERIVFFLAPCWRLTRLTRTN